MHAARKRYNHMSCSRINLRLWRIPQGKKQGEQAAQKERSRTYASKTELMHSPIMRSITKKILLCYQDKHHQKQTSFTPRLNTLSLIRSLPSYSGSSSTVPGRSPTAGRLAHMPVSVIICLQGFSRGAVLNNEILNAQKCVNRTKKDSDILTIIPNDKEIKEVIIDERCF